MPRPISAATASTWERSVSPVSLGGVPSALKMTSAWRIPAAMPVVEAGRSGHEAPDQALGDHAREEQEEIEVGEEEEREPAALIFRMPRKLDGEPHEAPAQHGGHTERDGSADAESGRDQRPGGEPRGVEEDEPGGAL